MLSEHQSLMIWPWKCLRMMQMLQRIHLFSLDMVSIHSSIWCNNSSGLPSSSPSFWLLWWLSSRTTMDCKRNKDTCSTNSLSETWEVQPLLATNTVFQIKKPPWHATMELCPQTKLNLVSWALNLTNKLTAESKLFGMSKLTITKFTAQNSCNQLVPQIQFKTKLLDAMEKLNVKLISKTFGTQQLHVLPKSRKNAIAKQVSSSSKFLAKLMHH